MTTIIAAALTWTVAMLLFGGGVVVFTRVSRSRGDQVYVGFVLLLLAVVFLAISDGSWIFKVPIVLVFLAVALLVFAYNFKIRNSIQDRLEDRAERKGSSHQ
jgi:hypothetical protein